MFKRPFALSFAVAATVGCKPPPDAPDDLENLSEYIFAHMGDEDTAELEAGIANLKIWLETDSNLESTLEGYTVNDLKDESVNALDDVERSIRDSLYGAAVAHEYDHSMKDLKQTMFVDDWSAVSSGTYDCSERVYASADQPSCIVDGSCMELSYETDSVSSWAGAVDVISTSLGEVRRIDIDGEEIILQRTWLEGPSETSGLLGDKVELYAQYFVNIMFPSSTGSILRTTATWMDVQVGDIDNLDLVKNQIVNTMKGQNDTVTEWITGDQDDEGSCFCSDFDYEEKECIAE
jgi:hypothetical protein